MTNGISVNDMVQVKSTGEIGRVVAIDDHTDRLPADLQVEFRRSLFVDELIKLHVEEVIRVTEY